MKTNASKTCRLKKFVTARQKRKEKKDMGRLLLLKAKVYKI